MHFCHTCAATRVGGRAQRPRQGTATAIKVEPSAKHEDGEQLLLSLKVVSRLAPLAALPEFYEGHHSLVWSTQSGSSESWRHGIVDRHGSAHKIHANLPASTALAA